MFFLLRVIRTLRPEFFLEYVTFCSGKLLRDYAHVSTLRTLGYTISNIICIDSAYTYMAERFTMPVLRENQKGMVVLPTSIEVEHGLSVCHVLRANFRTALQRDCGSETPLPELTFFSSQEEASRYFSRSSRSPGVIRVMVCTDPGDPNLPNQDIIKAQWALLARESTIAVKVSCELDRNEGIAVSFCDHSFSLAARDYQSQAILVPLLPEAEAPFLQGGLVDVEEANVATREEEQYP